MTFWRWLFFLIKIGVVAVLAIWVALRPGHVSFVWLGYRVDTSMGVLLAILLLLLLLFVGLHALWRLVWRGPRDLGRLRRASASAARAIAPSARAWRRWRRGMRWRPGARRGSPTSCSMIRR